MMFIYLRRVSLLNWRARNVQDRWKLRVSCRDIIIIHVYMQTHANFSLASDWGMKMINKAARSEE